MPTTNGQREKPRLPKLKAPSRTLPKRPPKRYGKANIANAIAALPQASERVLEDVQLVDNGSLGVRMFRVYGPVPRHRHQYSDTYLHIVSGRGEFAVEDEPSFEAGEGDMIFWVRGTDHQVVRVIEEPLVVYAIDSPTRRCAVLF